MGYWSEEKGCVRCSLSLRMIIDPVFCAETILFNMLDRYCCSHFSGNSQMKKNSGDFRQDSATVPTVRCIQWKPLTE
jgi:hypothetical protein